MVDLMHSAPREIQKPNTISLYQVFEMRAANSFGGSIQMPHIITNMDL